MDKKHKQHLSFMISLVAANIHYLTFKTANIISHYLSFLAKPSHHIEKNKNTAPTILMHLIF